MQCEVEPWNGRSPQRPKQARRCACAGFAGRSMARWSTVGAAGDVGEAGAASVRAADELHLRAPILRQPAHVEHQHSLRHGLRNGMARLRIACARCPWMNQLRECMLISTIAVQSAEAAGPESEMASSSSPPDPLASGFRKGSTGSCMIFL